MASLFLISSGAQSTELDDLIASSAAIVSQINTGILMTGAATHYAHSGTGISSGQMAGTAYISSAQVSAYNAALSGMTSYLPYGSAQTYLEEQAQAEFPRISASDPAPQSTAPAPVEDLDAPEERFEDAPEEPIAGETENLVQQATKEGVEKATKDIGEGLVEKGLTSGVGDLVAGAIPVVGEGLLAVAGLVSIGEGIYHLFHHKSKQPVVNTVATGAMPSAPSNLTQKYSLALPSIDSASEASASVSSF